jgi:hypothetical protein
MTESGSRAFVKKKERHMKFVEKRVGVNGVLKLLGLLFVVVSLFAGCAKSLPEGPDAAGRSL